MMTPFLQLALALSIIILAAKLGGYLSFRFGQPTVLGELAVGVLLGPSIINLLGLPYFSDTHLPDVIHEFAEIGVMLLMFLAGLDLHLKDLLSSSKVSAFAGTLGVIFPLLLGTGIGMLFQLSLTASIFIGLILSATSVSISAQTLMELKVLRSRVGISMLGAAVFDDILVVLALSIFIALTQSGASSGWVQVAGIAFWMAVYLLMASVLGYLILPRLSRLASRLPISQGLLSFTFVTLLLYGWLAETMGNMAAITGAFLAGLWLSRSPLKARIQSGVAGLAYGVFVPVFFINVGLSVNVRELAGEGLLLFTVMTVIAVVGKIAGSGLGALWSGFSRKEALQLGTGMMSRGEVGLIVATVGITEGVISPEVFSAAVGVVIITTLLTPPALRALFAKKEQEVKPVLEKSEGEDQG